MCKILFYLIHFAIIVSVVQYSDLKNMSSVGKLVEPKLLIFITMCIYLNMYSCISFCPRFSFVVIRKADFAILYEIIDIGPPSNYIYNFCKNFQEF